MSRISERVPSAVLLIVACALWGAATVMNKALLFAIPPVGLLTIQLIPSAAVLWVAMWLNGIRLRLKPAHSPDRRYPLQSFLRAQFGKGEPAAPASPSRGPGNGILRAETGGLFQAQNAGEQSEFGSQTTLRLTNPPELRGGFEG